MHVLDVEYLTYSRAFYEVRRPVYQTFHLAHFVNDPRRVVLPEPDAASLLVKYLPEHLVLVALA